MFYKNDMVRLTFILVGGTIPSLNDDDWHYISSPKLKELYGLRNEFCIMADEEDKISLNSFEIEPNQIILRPLLFGDYENYIQNIIDIWEKMYGNILEKSFKVEEILK